MIIVDKFNIIPLSMVTYDGLQKIDISYKCNKVTHLFLDVCKEEQKIVSDIEVVFDCGEYIASVLLPEQDEEFYAQWILKDKDGNVVAQSLEIWKKVRELTIYTMISSHTDIGLHNSQYIQRYNSSRFVDKATEICDKTADSDINNKYRYTIEGTWFWNNYGMDRGKNAAQRIADEYIKTGKMGICCGVAGNHTQTYGIEELCRSAYEKKRLFNEWGLTSETMSMIDNNGMSMSLIQPYVEAGYKNIIFAPNHWNPMTSSIWKIDPQKPGFMWNTNASGGGSRCAFNYASDLPMVFYWEDFNNNRLLVWGSAQYEHGGTAFGLFPYWTKGYNLNIMEGHISRQLPLFESKYPYDIWLLACYADDQEPSMYPTSMMAEWNKKWRFPQIRTLGNPDEPFDILRKKYNDIIPVLHGELAGGWYQHPLSAPDLLARKKAVDRELPNTEKWTVIASLLDDGYEYPDVDFGHAWDYLLFNDEHSYGVSGYQGRRVYETWMQHRDWIKKAEFIAETEKNNALKVISQNIFSDRKKTVVFNPTAVRRQELVYTDSGNEYILADIPAFGYKTISDEDFSSIERSVENTDIPPVIENKYYKIIFAENGSLSSIYDKELKRELLDNSSYGANELIYTNDNHKTFFTPLRAKFTITKEPECTTVFVQTKEEHLQTDMEIVIKLLNYEKRIDIDNKLHHVKDMINKNRYNRYIYYAFPFDVENCKRYCNLNGSIAEYAKTVTGHCTDVYMAVNEWCCSENDEFGVALMMLDSQLVEYDHIHPDKTDYGNTGDGSHMYVYAANDWLQMYTPGGSHLEYRFRYSITSYKGNYSGAKIPQRAELYANPVCVTAIGAQNGNLNADSFSFFSETDLRFLALKRADDGNGIIARFFGEEEKLNINSFIGLEKERVSVDETSMKTVSSKGFLTYRLGKGTVMIKTKECTKTDCVGKPASIGSVYTGLITEPCAACGENEGHLYLLWGQNKESDFSHYKLYRAEQPDFIADEKTFVADVMPEEYCVGRFEDTGLKEHTAYYYRVCAVNKAGVCGELSKVFCGITKESI